MEDSISRASIRVATANGLSKVASLILVLATTAVVGAEEYGKFVVAQATATMLAALASVNIAALVSRDTAALLDPARRGEVLHGALRLTLPTLLLLSASAYWLISLQPNPAQRLITYLCVVSAASGSLSTTLCLATFQGSGDFRMWGRISILKAVLPAVGALVGWVVLGPWPTALILGTAVGEICTAAFALAMAKPTRGSSSKWRNYLLESRFTLISTVSLALSNWLIPTLLAWSPSGFAASTYFNIASRAFFGASFLTQSMTTAMSRSILGFTGNESDRKELLRASTHLALASGATSLFLVIGAVVLRELPALNGAVLPLIVLAAAGFPVSLNAVLGYVAIARGALIAWVISDVVLAACGVGITATLAPDWGAAGAAVGFLVSYVVSVATLCALLQARGQLPRLPWPR